MVIIFAFDYFCCLTFLFIDLSHNKYRNISPTRSPFNSLVLKSLYSCHHPHFHFFSDNSFLFSFHWRRIDWLNDSFIWLVDWSIGWWNVLLIDRLSDTFIHWLSDWWIAGLIVCFWCWKSDWLFVWLSNWLTNCSMDGLVAWSIAIDCFWLHFWVN